MEKPKIVELLEDLSTYFDMDSGEWATCNVINSEGYQGGLVEDRLQQVLIDLQEFVNDYNQNQIEEIEGWQGPVRYATKSYHLWQDGDD